MSSSIAGLHAIASKPGQSLAPMIGWFVLRSAGYSANAATTITIASPQLSKDDPATVEGGGIRGEQPQATGAPDAAATHAAVTEGGNGEVFNALLHLLIFLPGMVGLVQVCLWQAYRLHGVVLGTYSTVPYLA